MIFWFPFLRYLEEVMILLLSFKKNKAIEDKNKKSFLFLLLVVFLLLFSQCEENGIYLAFEELNKNLIN
jgi:hypothetical protein